MHLDHVSYACTSGELADVVQRIGADLGAAFQDGGRHPAFGTRNFILPLQGGTYLEIVAALDHPAAEKAPFGQAVRRRAEDGGGWMGWVVAVDDMSAVEARLGRSAVPGSRVRPDGHELRWQQIGVLDLMSDPQLPFFVKWECVAAEHPSAGSSSVGIDLIEVSGDADVVDAWLGKSSRDPLEGIKVQWTDVDDAGIQAITFRTPNGVVRID